MNIIINIFPKKEILNPEAESIKKSLANLGFNKIDGLSLGKQIKIKINEKSKKKAHNQAKEMCEKLLANSVIEDYKINKTVTTVSNLVEEELPKYKKLFADTEVKVEERLKTEINSYR